MKKLFSIILIILVFIVALGATVSLIRKSGNTAPPDDGGSDVVPDTPDTPNNPTSTEKIEKITVAGTTYWNDSEIDLVSGRNCFALDFDEEYLVTVEWDNDKLDRYLDFKLDSGHVSFDKKVYLKSVKIEKFDKCFYISFPSIDDYIMSVHKKAPSYIDYSVYEGLKFNLLIRRGEKKINYVLSVDLSKCIPEFIQIESEGLCL